MPRGRGSWQRGREPGARCPGGLPSALQVERVKEGAGAWQPWSPPTWGRDVLPAGGCHSAGKCACRSERSRPLGAMRRTPGWVGVHTEGRVGTLSLSEAAPCGRTRGSCPRPEPHLTGHSLQQGLGRGTGHCRPGHRRLGTRAPPLMARGHRCPTLLPCWLSPSPPSHHLPHGRSLRAFTAVPCGSVCSGHWGRPGTEAQGRGPVGGVGTCRL